MVSFSGYNWNLGVDYHALFQTYKYSGFQATNFGLAVDEINKMLAARKVPLEEDQTDAIEEDEFIRRKSSCTIFLGYTSNMASCGMRDTIRFLVQHKMVSITRGRRRTKMKLVLSVTARLILIKTIKTVL